MSKIDFSKSLIPQLLDDLGKDKTYFRKNTLEKTAYEYGISDQTEAKEYIEFAVFLAAKEIVAKYKDDSEKTFEKLVQLYNIQPNISHRSSRSTMFQQYSTPIPIAYAMGMFCDIDKPGNYYEPTAGNGLLTIGGNPKNFTVNELDVVRNDVLKMQGFHKITNLDASDTDLIHAENYRKYDAVLTNPPFDKLPYPIIYDGMKVDYLDHLLAFVALDCMADNGKCAIIVGGHTEYTDKGAVKQGKNSKFMHFINNRYNLIDCINIDGSLYRKQGTTFDIRLLLIDGRLKEKGSKDLPLYPELPKYQQKIETTFEGIFERVLKDKNKMNSKPTYSLQEYKARALKIKLLMEAEYPMGWANRGGRSYNSGYTEREDGTRISVNALSAEENGTFSKGNFRKNYGVSVADFDLFVELRLIVQNEWHHTGKSFKETDFYSWADSDRVSDKANTYTYDSDYFNSENKEDYKDSLAERYRRNKKEIAKLQKEFKIKNWEYKIKQYSDDYAYTFEEFSREKYNKYWQDYLTEQENKTLKERHSLISSQSDVMSSYERKLEHESLDSEYRKIAEKRREKEIKENEPKLKKLYKEEIQPIIDRKKKIEIENSRIREYNENTNGKEKIIVDILEIMGTSREKAIERASDVSAFEFEKLEKENIKKKKEEHNKTIYEEIEKAEQKLQKWLNKQISTGKAHNFSRVSSIPEFSEVTESEYEGRYGYFSTNKGHYNLPEYHSGIAFSTKTLFKNYMDKKHEISLIKSKIQY